MERPDFYILTVDDWTDYLNEKYKDKIGKGVVIITSENVPVYPKHIVKSTGKPYEGTDIKPQEIEQHRERWEKIISAVS